MDSSSPLPRLLGYASAHRPRIAVAVLCSVLNKLFDLAPPVLIGMAVDVVVRRDGSALGRLGVTAVEDQLAVVVALTIAVWILESAFEYAHRVLWRNLAQTLEHEMRLDAYAHVQGLELAYFEDRSTGGLLAVLNDDVNQLERFLDAGAAELVQVATTVIAICAYFLFLDLGVGLWAMLPMPFILAASIRYQRVLAPRYTDVRERVGLMNGQLANNLGGIATIKSFTAEEREVERIRGLSDGYRTSNRSAIAWSSAFSPGIRMLVLVGFTAMLWVGGKQVVAGELSEGSYAVIVFGIQRLLWPLTRLGETFDLYQRSMASARRILDLLDTTTTIPSGERSLLAPVAGEVRFEDVGFSYRDMPPVFEGLTLTLEAGRTTAIVGSTGSGKTTLIKLLLRFYDVGTGRVVVDGVDVRDLRLASLRSAIGLVSQDTFLFHGTIAENIAYGRPDATPAEIEESARVAEAHDFIRAFPRGYDTIVGERGQKVSGGQRQRIAIARAVLLDPPILVLDEATSSVDNETEAAIQRSLERIAVGRTTIVIAHRLSTVRHADRIHVLAEGGVREEGHHEDLLERDGLYAALWKVQTGSAIDHRDNPLATGQTPGR